MLWTLLSTGTGGQLPTPKHNLKLRSWAKQQECLVPIDYNDFFNHLRINISQVQSRNWQQSNPKLWQIKDNLENWPPLCENRREEVLISRLRLGHYWFSHHHLMITDGPRVSTLCIVCSLEPMTVKHIFVECPSLRQRRARYFILLQ